MTFFCNLHYQSLFLWIKMNSVTKMTKWLKNSIYMVKCKPLISVRPIPPPLFEGTNLKLSQITVHYKRLNWWLFFQNFNQFDYCETEKTHYISYLICKGTWMYIIWQSFSFQNYVFLTYFVRSNTFFIRSFDACVKLFLLTLEIKWNQYWHYIFLCQVIAIAI